MTFLITNSETLDKLAALSGAIDTAKATAAAVAENVAEASQRAASLRRSIAEHQVAQPAADPNMANDLSAMIAADPGAATSADWTGKLREAQDAHEAALTAWKGKLSILEQALARVAAEVAERSAASEPAAAAVNAAVRAFNAEASKAVMGEMLARWEAFAADTLDVAVAFERVVGFQQTCHINFSEHGVALTGHGGAVVQWLYRTNAMDNHTAAAVVDGFRGALVQRAAETAPASSPPPRRAGRG